MYRDRQQATTQPRTETQAQQQYTVQHDFDSSASVTATLTHALSNAAGVDVTQAESALKDHVDPHALNRLFVPRSERSVQITGHVTLDIRGYRTTLYGNGYISISTPQNQQQS
jgi:hypothetical protein